MMKDMSLPSGRLCGVPMVIADDWRTAQVVAVTELLQDLLQVIHSRYRSELYAYWKTARITEFEVDDSTDNQGVPF